MPDDPYATHIPVLQGLANSLQLRNVLEFGAGKHSTAFFLSLPELERLVSIETDPDWFERIADEFRDPRLQLCKATSGSPSDFDLVFIDDGEAPSQRLETINWVLAQDCPPVVIHDAEVAPYRDAIRDLGGGRSMMFCLETPFTALVWPEGWGQDRYEIAREVSRCVP